MSAGDEDIREALAEVNVALDEATREIAVLKIEKHELAKSLKEAREIIAVWSPLIDKLEAERSRAWADAVEACAKAVKGTNCAGWDRYILDQAAARIRALTPDEGKP